MGEPGLEELIRTVYKPDIGGELPEELVEELESLPEPNDDLPYYVGTADVPVTLFHTKIGVNNYRQVGDIFMLAASIKNFGLLEFPCVAYYLGTRSMELIDGERRVLATRAGGSDRIPVRVYLDPPRSFVEEMKLAANLKSKISPWDLSSGYHELKNLERDSFVELMRQNGIKKSPGDQNTTTEVSRVTGRNPKTVANGLLFAKLPSKIRKDVAEHKAHYGMAVELARHFGTVELEKLWAHLVIEPREYHERASKAKGTALTKLGKKPAPTPSVRTVKQVIKENGSLRGFHVNGTAYNDFVIRTGDAIDSLVRRTVNELAKKSKKALDYVISLTTIAIYEPRMREKAYTYVVRNGFENDGEEYLDYLKKARTRLTKLLAAVEPALLEESRRLAIKSLNSSRFVRENLLERGVGGRVRTRSQQLVKLNPTEVVETENIRLKYDNLNELATSLRLVGQIKPGIVVRTEQGYTPVVGHRRKLAAEMAGIDYLAYVLEEATSQERMAIQYAEDRHKTHSLSEQVYALNRIWEARLSEKQAESEEYSVREFKDEMVSIGIDSATADNAMLIAEAPEPFRALIYQGAISASKALEIINESDEAESLYRVLMGGAPSMQRNSLFDANLKSESGRQSMDVNGGMEMNPVSLLEKSYYIIEQAIRQMDQVRDQGSYRQLVESNPKVYSGLLQLETALNSLNNALLMPSEANT